MARNPLPAGIPQSFSGPNPRFLVEGLFHVADFCMVKGRVLSGEIFPGYHFSREGKTFSIKEVQRDGRKDKVIIKGDLGALFLRVGDKPVIFNNEILELTPPQTKSPLPPKKKPRPKTKPAIARDSGPTPEAALLASPPAPEKPFDSPIKLETPINHL